MSDDKRLSASGWYAEREARWDKKYESLLRRSDLPMRPADRQWVLKQLEDAAKSKPYWLEKLYLIQMDMDNIGVPELPSEPQA